MRISERKEEMYRYQSLKISMISNMICAHRDTIVRHLSMTPCLHCLAQRKHISKEKIIYSKKLYGCIASGKPFVSPIVKTIQQNGGIHLVLQCKYYEGVCTLKPLCGINPIEHQQQKWKTLNNVTNSYWNNQRKGQSWMDRNETFNSAARLQMEHVICSGWFSLKISQPAYQTHQLALIISSFCNSVDRLFHCMLLSWNLWHAFPFSLPISS